MINHDKDNHSSPFWSIGYLLQRHESTWQWARNDSGRHQVLVSPSPTAPLAAIASPAHCCGCTWLTLFVKWLSLLLPQMEFRVGWAVSNCCFTALLLWRSFCRWHWSPEAEKNRALRPASSRLHEKGCTALSYRPSEIPTSPPTHFQNQVGSSLFPER